MGCGSCSTTKNGVPQGCGDKGHCTSGTCNKRNTYDWLSDLDLYDPSPFQYVEVSFKKGSYKAFYKNDQPTNFITGDLVIVEAQSGYDLGRISLSGELVRAQMKKKRTDPSAVSEQIVRHANHRDVEKLNEARSLERNTMIRGRAIARSLDVDLKLGDVIYRADKRKATFYYTANGRIDFRELVRNYAKEFRVKVEMKQIGARQESALIGGIGACGRELCCSTWLSDFQTVSTAAARYQNISINQTKLSGQCGRLKCCLNFELDTYLDALENFPKKADYLYTEMGKAQLIKIDIFKGLMFYAYILERGRAPIVSLSVDRVKEILAANARKEKPEDLKAKEMYEDLVEEVTFAADEMTDVIELPQIKKRRSKKSRKGKQNPNANRRGRGNNRNRKQGQKAKDGKEVKSSSNQKANKPGKKRNNQNRNKKKSDQ